MPVLDAAIKPMLDEKREALLKAHPVVRAVNWKELASLSAMPSAPKRLTGRAIAWGKASKGDDGAAEALALAVRRRAMAATGMAATRLIRNPPRSSCTRNSAARSGRRRRHTGSTA